MRRSHRGRGCSTEAARRTMSSSCHGPARNALAIAPETASRCLASTQPSSHPRTAARPDGSFVVRARTRDVARRRARDALRWSCSIPGDRPGEVARCDRLGRAPPHHAIQSASRSRQSACCYRLRTRRSGVGHGGRDRLADPAWVAARRVSVAIAVTSVPSAWARCSRWWSVSASTVTSRRTLCRPQAVSR